MDSAYQTPQQVVQRARIVLLAAGGETDPDIAAQLRLNRKSVALWRHRFLSEGVGTLWEVAPGRGRKPTYSAAKVKAIVDATLQTRPEGMTQWSCRLMAEAQGVSKATVNRIWQSHNIKPHLVKNFKLSRDARFLEKLTDVMGLYLNPPEKAIVLCIDEKSQIVERWFGELTSKRIRRGVFTSVADLQAAIEEFLNAWNAKPKPFVWTATVESILAKLPRCRQTLEQIEPGCTLPRRRKKTK